MPSLSALLPSSICYIVILCDVIRNDAPAFSAEFGDHFLDRRILVSSPDTSIRFIIQVYRLIRFELDVAEHS